MQKSKFKSTSFRLDYLLSDRGRQVGGGVGVQEGIALIERPTSESTGFSRPGSQW